MWKPANGTNFRRFLEELKEHHAVENVTHAISEKKKEEEEASAEVLSVPFFELTRRESEHLDFNVGAGVNGK